MRVSPYTPTEKERTCCENYREKLRNLRTLPSWTSYPEEFYNALGGDAKTDKSPPDEPSWAWVRAAKFFEKRGGEEKEYSILQDGKSR
mmetsp:Transcript_27264/g.68765  ORF Transcript_27264/g.68765 Transcript_27264/m.68765 type:complete len:88 (+) Transcript_27264:74-337(+)